MPTSRASTPAAERRDRNRREMRDTILGAARRMVNAGGVNALSMRAVAREIGYSAAALYEYFPSKSALCQALFFEGASGLSGHIRLAIAESGEGASAGGIVAAMGRAYREYALSNRELYLLVFANPVREFVPDEQDREEASTGFDMLVQSMRAGVEGGQMREMDPEVAALSAWAVVHGFVMLEIVGYVGSQGDSNDKLFDNVLEHVGNWHRPAHDQNDPS